MCAPEECHGDVLIKLLNTNNKTGFKIDNFDFPPLG